MLKREVATSKMEVSMNSLIPLIEVNSMFHYDSWSVQRMGFFSKFIKLLVKVNKC